MALFTTVIVVAVLKLAEDVFIPLALAILEGRFVPGDVVRVDAGEGELVLEKAQATAAAA